jgi:hypothetical protein
MFVLLAYIILFFSDRTLYIRFHLDSIGDMLGREHILTKSDFKDYCSFCGMAITQVEMAADIQGNLVLFDEKTTGSIQMTLCADCKNKLMEFATAGLEGAIQRRLGIDNTISKVKKTRARRHKNDDEDDTGGVSAVLPP